MTELATRDATAVDAPPPLAVQPASGLLLWAQEARQAHQIAMSLARTSFVPQSLCATDRTHPDLSPEERYAVTAGNITAAILTGSELGLKPMAALRSTDIIRGTPAMRAHAMRGLVQSKGHEVEPVVQTDDRVTWRGRRKGSTAWIEVEWTIDRARRLGAVGRNEQYKAQPKTMLNARATGEICRLVAADVLLGMPYAAEELDAPEDAPTQATGAAGPVTAAEILGNGSAGTLRPSEPAAEAPADPPPDAAEPPPATGPGQNAMRGLHAALGRLGLGDDRREDKLAVYSDLLSRPVGSSTELSGAEAEQIAAFARNTARQPADDQTLTLAEVIERGRGIRAGVDGAQ